ncbi:MAG: hypothetical protein KAJ37_09645 [Candidatus Krumholzibacteria bacterium]|nr:hypothetical protein [Candidatus Krumholzibacteria bacterium]
MRFRDRARKAYQALTGRDVYDQSLYDAPRRPTHDKSDRPIGSAVLTDATGEGRLSALSLLDWFAESFTPATICIQKRQEQVAALDYTFQPKQGKDPEAPEVEDQVRAATEYFGYGGGLGGPRTLWRAFTDKVIWSALSIDAVPLFVDRQAGEGVSNHRLLNGLTIAPVLDANGWTPEPPEIAYKQWTNGKVTGQFTADALHYFVLKPRPKTPYGFPPTEAIVTAILTYLYTENWNIDFFLSGSKEDGFWEMAEGLTPKQWPAFEDFIDKVDPAKPAKGGHGKSVPHGTKHHPWKVRSDMEWDKLQLRIITLCAAMYGLNAATIGFAGEVYKEAQEGQVEASKRWGLVPLMKNVGEIANAILRDLGLDLIEHGWAPEENDPVEMSTVISTVGPAVLTRNAARRRLGEDVVEDSPLANCLYEVLPSGILVFHDPDRPGEKYMIEANVEAPVSDDPEAALEEGPDEDEELEPGDAPPDDADEDAIDDEADQALRQWRRKARVRIPAGRPAPFATTAIPPRAQVYVAQRLEHCQSRDDVDAVFAAVRDPANLGLSLTESFAEVRGMVESAIGTLDHRNNGGTN